MCSLCKKTGNLPISEHFEVWKYGPVVASVYNEFKSFGSKPITTLAKDAKGKSQIIDERLAPILSKTINSVWAELKFFSGVELSQKTHQKGSGWYMAFQAEKDAISTTEMKNDRTI